MSFHEAGSDLSRLNREAWRGPVGVDRHTGIVLRQALEIAPASRGVLDPTVAGQLAAAGVTPRPVGAPDPDDGAAIVPDGMLYVCNNGGIGPGFVTPPMALAGSSASTSPPADPSSCTNAATAPSSPPRTT